MKKHITANNHKGVTETGIIMQVCTLMNNRGYCVWRHSNTGTFNAREAKAALMGLYLAVKHGQLSPDNYETAIDTIFGRAWKKTPGIFPGIFDITGFNLSTGKLVAIEIKLGSDELRPEQRDFMAKVKAAGGEVYVVRDFPLFSHNFMARHRAEMAI